MNNKRVVLNGLVRQIGSGIAFANSETVSEGIKQAWDDLYFYYYNTTGLDIKAEADNRGYKSALDFVERTGCLDKLCEIAVKIYRNDFTTLAGKHKTEAVISALM